MTHHHTDHADWTEQLAMLEQDGQLSEPWLTNAIGWLIELSHPSYPRRVIDVGAGPGVAACLLATALPEAAVLAYDPTRALLDRALERARERGLQDRVHVHQGSIGPELADLDPAELIWCSRVLHHLDDPRAGIAQIGAALTDNGLLAIAEGGLPMRFLPGGYGVAQPSFVSRLDAASGDHSQTKWSLTDAANVGDRDWPVVIGEAGLEHVASRTFVLDLPAPLDGPHRRYVLDRFAGLYETVHDKLSEEDAHALFRLTDPEDPAALTNREDLFVLGAFTVHVARRARH
jgi:SAM-dependent methyltransferase